VIASHFPANPMPDSGATHSSCNGRRIRNAVPRILVHHAALNSAFNGSGGNFSGGLGGFSGRFRGSGQTFHDLRRFG
jgi:hypothetical protein